MTTNLSKAEVWMKWMKEKHSTCVDNEWNNGYHAGARDFCMHLDASQEPQPVECEHGGFCISEARKCVQCKAFLGWMPQESKLEKPVEDRISPKVLDPKNLATSSWEKPVEPIKDRFSSFTPDECTILRVLLQNHANTISEIALTNEIRVSPYLAVIEALENELNS